MSMIRAGRYYYMNEMQKKSISFFVLGIAILGMVCLSCSIYAQQTAPSLNLPVVDAAQTTPEIEEEPVITEQATTPTEAVIEKPVEKSPSKNTAEEEKNIYLNFDNADLSNFINYIADLKKLNLVSDKGVEGAKISLNIREPLSIDGAWNVFITVLEMAGFSIVHVGDIHKIIPKDQKLTQPLPAYINVPVETLPDSDITLRYVVFLDNLNVTSIEPLLTSMLSGGHSLLPQPDINAFIITDKSYNIKSAIKVIQELDKAGQPETVSVIRLKQANAVDVKTLLESLIKEQEESPLARLLKKHAEGTSKYFQSVKMIAEPRLNTLILLGALKPIQKIESFITEYIDTDLKAMESPLHIYELQYTDATQIANILREVTRPPDSGPGQDAARYGAVRNGAKYFKSMNFQVDKDGNRLIISSTDKEDWKMLKRTIKDLDKPQPQVAIETLFVSISAQDLKQFGGAIRNKKHGQIGKNIDFQAAMGDNTGSNAGASFETSNGNPVSLLGSMLSQFLSKQGASVLTFGKAANIWAMLQAVKTSTSTSVLSQPFITITNKQEGIIESGETLRIQTQKTANGLVGKSDVSARTKVVITPQINLDGVVRMHIVVDITDFTDTASGATQTKKIDTSVTIADGQVMVLGGFIKTQISESLQKSPLLGDIPVLGWFFKNQNRTLLKSHIFIFMRPVIVKPRQLPGVNLYTKMKLHAATQDIENEIKTTKSNDPIFNWFFDPTNENYSHKVVDFADARYQPTTVDIKNDPYYRSITMREEMAHEATEESIEEEEEEQEEIIIHQTASLPTASFGESPDKNDQEKSDSSQDQASEQTSYQAEQIEQTEQEPIEALPIEELPLQEPIEEDTSKEELTQSASFEPLPASPQEQLITKAAEEKIKTEKSDLDSLEDKRQQLRALLQRTGLNVKRSEKSIEPKKISKQTQESPEQSVQRIEINPEKRRSLQKLLLTKNQLNEDVEP